MPDVEESWPVRHEPDWGRWRFPAEVCPEKALIVFRAFIIDKLFGFVIYRRQFFDTGWNNNCIREELTEIRENRMRSRHCDRLRNFNSHRKPRGTREGGGVGLKPEVRRRCFSRSLRLLRLKGE